MPLKRTRRAAPPPSSDLQAEAAQNLAEARRLFEDAQAAAIAAGVVEAPAVHAKKETSVTVWVGCKMPNGLLLQLQEIATIDRPVMGGGIKPTKVAMRTGERVRLRGFAVPFGRIPKHTIIKDYALTEVRRDFWEAWLEQNKNLDIVKSGLIFHHADKIDAEAQANDQGDDIKSWLEPLDPVSKKDPRVEKVGHPNLSQLDTDEDRDAFKYAS